jgi:hypothetical protein
MCRKFVSNPWTDVAHGHARTELNSLKNLIEQNAHECSIISESKDFGDVIVTRSSHSFEARIFLRNPFYTLARYWQIYTYFRKTIEKFRRIAEPGDDLIFSSLNFEQFVIASIFFKKQKFSLRLFNCPRSDLSKKIRFLARILLKFNTRKIAAETKEITAWLSFNLHLNAQVVPPLTLLRNQTKTFRFENRDLKKGKVGIMYPVTSYFDSDEFQVVLDNFKEQKVKVKFPISYSPLVNSTNMETIPNGISDEILRDLIYDLDVVVLMNHNYVNRGSGLLTLCMSLGCYIFLFEDNNYVESYREHYPIIPIVDIKHIFEKSILDLNTVEDPEIRMKLSHEFVDYVNLRWEKFLNVK